MELKRYTLRSGRNVVEPQEPYKTQLKEHNARCLPLVEEILKKNRVDDVPHAYRPHLSVVHNARKHQNARRIFKFDIRHYYDSIRYEDIKPWLAPLALPEEKDLYIDPVTNGLIQGSPLSGVFANLVMIPFWVAFKNDFPGVTMTQYSDDITISDARADSDADITIYTVHQQLVELLNQTGLGHFKFNKKKMTTHKNQYRRITGVQINHKNQLCMSRKDYRRVRSLLHNAKNKTGNDLKEELNRFGITSTAQLRGQIQWLLQLDQSFKLRKFLNRNGYKELIKKAEQCFKELSPAIK